ncbi:MAG: sodium:calcium antiporter, partial [Clostridia bacterium]|nr:sodium:calcium antiporter [Clostridia bacterium]
MFINIILMAIGFVLLVKGADWLLKGAIGIAKKSHISEIL